MNNSAKIKRIEKLLNVEVRLKKQYVQAIVYLYNYTMCNKANMMKYNYNMQARSIVFQGEGGSKGEKDFTVR